MSAIDSSLDRVLPASPDAERSILGAVLLDNFAYTQATEKGLLPEDFYLDWHRKVFAAMRSLNDRGLPIADVTLREELGPDAIGISDLHDGSVTHPGAVEAVIKIVKDKALLRGVVYACDSAMAAAAEHGAKGAEVLESVESDIHALSASSIQRTFKTTQEIFKQNYADLSDFVNPEKHPGIKAGFRDLDMIVTLRPGDLIIIAGRPSMGKTALAMNIAEKQAVEKRRVVGVFSLETTGAAMLMRLACSMAKVNSQVLREGFCTAGDQERLFAALGRLFESPLLVDDSTDATVSQMRAKAKRIKHQHKRLDLIVIDHLQLMADRGTKHQNRTSEVTAITRGLKLMAKELDVPVIALSQLNRGTESGGDTEPRLKHLRESGSIEQDADVVALVYRPEYYDRRNPELKNKAKIIVEKNRDGACDTVELKFLHEYARFENAEEQDREGLAGR